MNNDASTNGTGTAVVNSKKSMNMLEDTDVDVRKTSTMTDKEETSTQVSLVATVTDTTRTGDVEKVNTVKITPANETDAAATRNKLK